MFDVSRAIEEHTAELACDQPASRTTLALALVDADTIQWATFGDSFVLVGDGESVVSLGTPRATYLGYSFVRAEVSALLTRGARSRSRHDYLVLATDGLFCAPSLVPGSIEPVLREGRDAEWTARRIVSLALEAGVADAVSVAVASPQAA